MMVDRCHAEHPLAGGLEADDLNDDTDGFENKQTADDEQNQFMIGPDLIAAPVTNQSNNTTGLTAWSVWVPPGTWWDALDGRLLFAHQPYCVVALCVAAD